LTDKSGRTIDQARCGQSNRSLHIRMRINLHLGKQSYQKNDCCYWNYHQFRTAAKRFRDLQRNYSDYVFSISSIGKIFLSSCLCGSWIPYAPLQQLLPLRLFQSPQSRSATRSTKLHHDKCTNSSISEGSELFASSVILQGKNYI
jgi:hypothetical protein